MEKSTRPKFSWIQQKSCFNKIQESQLEEEEEHLSGISPSERLGCMFKTGLYSDCSFLIDDTEIKTHKIILATASPKMEEMFLTPDADTDLVEVPYSLRVMQLILKHVYLQDMDIENIDEAQDVIEAAHYFEMKDLVELCCAGIEPETLEDLWPALNLACTYNSRILKEACLSLALEHSRSLLQHQGLLILSPEAMSFLLSREIVEVENEQEILNMVIDWARNRIENTDDSENNLRSELENCDILKQIRILSLPEEQFENFITGIGTEIFTEDEIEKLKYDYFGEICENNICPLRTDRMLEIKVPICGTDYLAVNEQNNCLSVKMKIYESENGLRPIIKSIVLPSQINPANILYDNVSHRTHYNECIFVELSVNNKIIARGSFSERIKYSDDMYINLFTFNHAVIYAHNNEEYPLKYYEAEIKVIFKTEGYYPLAVEIKCDENSPIVLDEPCRFIHEFTLITPKL